MIPTWGELSRAPRSPAPCCSSLRKTAVRRAPSTLSYINHHAWRSRPGPGEVTAARRHTGTPHCYQEAWPRGHGPPLTLPLYSRVCKTRERASWRPPLQLVISQGPKGTIQSVLSTTGASVLVHGAHGCRAETHLAVLGPLSGGPPWRKKNQQTPGFRKQNVLTGHS